MTVADIPVRHGYTMRDIDRFARAAVGIAYPKAMDYTDRYDAAWHAIAELLCSVGEAPSRRDLKLAGAHAVDLLAADARHHHGYDRGNLDIGMGGMARFQRYWQARVHPVTFDDAVVDRLAVAQIWPILTTAQQETVLAYAIHEDHTAAARATGRIAGTYRVHLGHARKRFRALWFEHETDPGLWARTYGHNDRDAIRVLSARRWQRARRAARKGQAA